jgi:hypothetical protein
LISAGCKGSPLDQFTRSKLDPLWIPSDISVHAMLRGEPTWIWVHAP